MGAEAGYHIFNTHVLKWLLGDLNESVIIFWTLIIFGYSKTTENMRES